VVAVWIATRAAGASGLDHIGIAWSDDGGQSWTRSPELSTTNDQNDDPVILAEPDGSFYVVWLGYAGQGVPDHIWGARSTDHGHTFGTPVVVNDTRNRGLDKPWIYAAGGTLYVTYAANNLGNPGAIMTVYMVTSTNHGATWSSVLQVSPNAHDTANLARIAADATYVYASYVNAPGNSDGSPQNAVYVTRKTLAALTFQAPVRASGVGESVVFQDTPIVATAAGLGVVYVNGNLTGSSHVAFVRSSDQGATFSSSLHVDDDGCMGVHMLPQLAAGPDGHLHVAFYDNRYGDPTGALWYAASIDGGQSFGLNQFASDHAFPFTTSRMTNLWLGDYVGLAVAGGRIYASWTDPRNQMQSQVYVASGGL